MLALKPTLDAVSPPFLRGLRARIEGSPLGYRLASGAFWSLAGSLISRGLGLLSAILVGRIVGKEGFGELGIIQSTVGVFGTLAGFGMGLTANKHVAEFKCSDPVRAGRIIGSAAALAWITSGIMALVLYVLAPWLAARTLAAPQLCGALQVGALLLWLSGINGAQTGALSGFEAFKDIAQINLVTGILSFPSMLFGAWFGGVSGVVWALVAVQLLNCFLCRQAVHSKAAKYEIAISVKSTAEDRRLLWSFSVPAVLTGVLNSIVAWGAGALVVNQAGGYGDMGMYNAALRVKMVPETLLGMLIAPMLPVLSETFGKGDRATFQRTLLVNFLLATLIIVPVSLVQAAAPALTMLPFGSAYAGRPAVVMWLMFHAVIYALTFPTGSVLISMGEMWFSWVANLIFGVCFITCAWVLVPRYSAAGYAAAMALAYIIANLPCIVFLHRKLPAVMKYLRWGLMAVTTILLFGTCALAARQASFAWSVATGILAAAAFLTLKYRLHAGSLRKLADPAAAAH